MAIAGSCMDGRALAGAYRMAVWKELSFHPALRGRCLCHPVELSPARHDLRAAHHRVRKAFVVVTNVVDVIHLWDSIDAVDQPPQHA